MLSTQRLSQLFQKYSENIGGAISFAGSLIPAATGDVQSIAAAGMFALSEVTFIRKGNTTAGYSLGALGFAAGDLALAFSSAVKDNTSLQVALVAMAGAWGIGALRYPFEKMGSTRIADTIPKIVGATCLALRAPGFVAAAASGNYPIMAAIGLWGTADILCGRLQAQVGPALKRLGLIRTPKM